MDSYGDFSYYYDMLMDDVDYKKWYLYIEEIFTTFNIKPNNILEMACGTGNLTYILCQNNYDVTGFDKSTEMLSIAYNKLFPFRNVKILNQDMINFNINYKYDCILSICDSINYIIDHENLIKVFQNVNKHLTSNGIFIFDINSHYKLSNIIGDNTFVEDREDIFYTWQNYFDREDKLACFLLTFFIRNENGLYRRFDEEHIERAYTLEEIIVLLKKAGFNKINYFESFTFEHPKDNSERINFVVQKG